MTAQGLDSWGDGISRGSRGDRRNEGGVHACPAHAPRPGAISPFMAAMSTRE